MLGNVVSVTDYYYKLNIKNSWEGGGVGRGRRTSMEGKLACEAEKR